MTPSSGFLYQWRLNNVNISGAVSSNYSATSAGSYSCNVYNNCGSVFSNSINVTTTAIPAMPGSITGATVNVCSAWFTYSVIMVAGATSYNWSAPPGASIISGQGTTSTVISFPAGFLTGTVSVTANNFCGASGASLRTVSGVPANAGAISGPTSVCHNQNQVYYSIAPVAGATNYAWTVPPGAHIQQGQGTVQIRMKFGFNAGNITVRASSSCGMSNISSLAVAMPCRGDETIAENSSGVIAYPNPANEFVSLQFDAAQKGDVNISFLDISGRLLKQEIYSAVAGENIFNTDVSAFAPGVYFVSVEVNSTIQMLRFVKE